LRDEFGGEQSEAVDGARLHAGLDEHHLTLSAINLVRIGKVSPREVGYARNLALCLLSCDHWSRYVPGL
jgi:hypothetical protein